MGVAPTATRDEREHERAAAAVPPEGGDLGAYSQAELDDIAAELNGRPRETLGWRSPAERFLALAEAG